MEGAGEAEDDYYDQDGAGGEYYHDDQDQQYGNGEAGIEIRGEDVGATGGGGQMTKMKTKSYMADGGKGGGYIQGMSNAGNSVKAQAKQASKFHSSSSSSSMRRHSRRGGLVPELIEINIFAGKVNAGTKEVKKETEIGPRPYPPIYPPPGVPPAPPKPPPMPPVPPPLPPVLPPTLPPFPYPPTMPPTKPTPPLTMPPPPPPMPMPTTTYRPKLPPFWPPMTIPPMPSTKRTTTFDIYGEGPEGEGEHYGEEPEYYVTPEYYDETTIRTTKMPPYIRTTRPTYGPIVPIAAPPPKPNKPLGLKKEDCWDEGDEDAEMAPIKKSLHQEADESGKSMKKTFKKSMKLGDATVKVAVDHHRPVGKSGATKHVGIGGVGPVGKSDHHHRMEAKNQYEAEAKQMKKRKMNNELYQLGPALKKPVKKEGGKRKAKAKMPVKKEAKMPAAKRFPATKKPRFHAMAKSGKAHKAKHKKRKKSKAKAGGHYHGGDKGTNTRKRRLTYFCTLLHSLKIHFRNGLPI